jgi:putative glutamine amidotransferase
MKKVLIPLAYKSFVENDIAPLHFIRETYLNKFKRFSIMPLFASTTMTEEMLNELYKLSDYVFFTGGSDFDPTLYTRDINPKSKPLEPNRDKLELKILSWVLRDKKPFIGICRGCQALNIACGGTLIQDLPEMGFGDGHNIKEGENYNHLLSTLHNVNIDTDSKAFEVLNSKQITVTSGHHQAIDILGKGLRVSGRSLDGVVEIIEIVDSGHFCFGIQGHPEAFEDSIFDRFWEEMGKL